MSRKRRARKPSPERGLLVYSNDGGGVRGVASAILGGEIEARAGDSVATALLAAGYRDFGCNAATGAPTAAYCLIGNCFGCLCEIDGRPQSQACLAPVAEGMKVSTVESLSADDRD